tara:strand:- start:30 stop:254 length:225 start_codon:yes stop_codon:yes gene_type:complete
MSKKKTKGYLAEGVLDTLFKGIVGTYFGGKMIDSYTKKQAMKDPTIQKKLKDLKKGLDDIDARLAKLKQMSSGA